MPDAPTVSATDPHREFAQRLLDAQGGPEDQETFLYTGISMNPLLNDGDRLLVTTDPGVSLVFGDIIIYRRREKFIIHRYFGRLAGRLVAKGDNVRWMDPLVKPECYHAKALAVMHPGEREADATTFTSDAARSFALRSCLEGLILGPFFYLPTKCIRMLRRIARRVKRNLIK